MTAPVNYYIDQPGLSGLTDMYVYHLRGVCL